MEPERIERRELTSWRAVFVPVCYIAGHKPALLRAIVPNPYAVDSYVECCSRCTKPLLRAAAAAPAEERNQQ